MPEHEYIIPDQTSHVPSLCPEWTNESDWSCGIFEVWLEERGPMYADKSGHITLGPSDPRLMIELPPLEQEQFSRRAIAHSLGRMLDLVGILSQNGTDVAACVGITYPAMARFANKAFGIHIDKAPLDWLGVMDCWEMNQNAKPHARRGEGPWSYARPQIVIATPKDLAAHLQTSPYSQR